MKLIIFILCVILIAGLLIRIILTRADSVSPLLMRLREAGIPVGDAERALAGGEFWQRQKAHDGEGSLFHEGIISYRGYEKVVSVPAGQSG